MRLLPRGENFADGFGGAGDDQVVGVEEGQTEACGQPAAERRFPAAAVADEKETHVDHGKVAAGWAEQQ